MYSTAGPGMTKMAMDASANAATVDGDSMTRI
jgi:hypothetical protein